MVNDSILMIDLAFNVMYVICLRWWHSDWSLVSSGVVWLLISSPIYLSTILDVVFLQELSSVLFVYEKSSKAEIKKYVYIFFLLGGW